MIVSNSGNESSSGGSHNHHNHHNNNNNNNNTNVVKPEDVDALLAREMNQMSVNERELIYEEIHGVDPVIEETYDFISNKLHAIEEEIQLIPLEDKHAYQMSQEMDSNFVHDKKFRLMFLRAERFDAKLAAIRLVKFMEGKLQFFGRQTLVRPIYMTDLNEEALFIFKSGQMQCLPARDRSGRAVAAHIKIDNMPEYSSIDNVVSFSFFALLSCKLYSGDILWASPSVQFVS